MGTQYGVLTMGQRQINLVFEVDSPTMISLMNTTIMIGGLFGSMYAQNLLKNFSRKQALYITDLISCLGILLSQIIDIRIFIAYRLIAGAALGINAALVP